jgi:hypothetical protein
MNRINVLDKSGQLVSIPEEQLKDAQAQGFQIATPDEAKSHFEQEEYTSGIKPALAGVAGAARALTFGVSDVALSGSNLVKPSTLYKLEEHNPVESIAGEVVGIGASMLVPGAGEVAAEQGLARAALRGATAPVRGATRLGQTVARATAEALPEATTAIGRIAQTATSQAVGAAAEGALYGFGRTLSEYGMGDPSLNGEKMMSHVGLSALLGGGMAGALGLTGAAAKEAIGKYKKFFPGAPSPAQVVEDLSPEFGVIGQEAGLAGKTEAEQQAWLKANSKVRKNIGEVEAAAADLGNAPITDGMRTDVEHLQRVEQAIRNRGTPVGVAIQEEYNKGWQKASEAVTETLGPEVKDSLASLGRSLKDGITEEFEKRIGPVTQLYDEIGKALPHIDISPNSRKGMAKSIMKLVQSEGLTPSMTQYKYVQGVANDILSVDNLQKLQNWRSALGKEVAPESKYIAGVIREKLNELEMRTIKGASLLVPDPQAKLAIQELISKIDQAKPAYAQLRKEMEKVGKNILGRKKIYGPQDFLNAIEDAKGVEGFAKALLKKENSEFMSFMQKEFPNQFKEIMQYHRGDIVSKATKDGALNPKKAADLFHDLEPEMRSMLLDGNQQKKMQSVETYLNAFPRNFNPSGTSAAEAYQRMLGNGIGGVVSGLGAMGMDAIQKIRLSAKVGSAEELHVLVQMENAAKRTAKKIMSGAADIFSEKSTLARPTAYAASKVADSLISHEKPEDVIADIRDVANNPQTFIDKIAKSTEAIQGIAPETNQALQMAAARAVQILAATAPQTTSDYPLGENPVPSRIDLHLFSQKMHLIKNPTDILKNIKMGTLTPEHVDLVKQIYPKLFQQMQSQVLEQMTGAISKKKKVNHRTKNMLSLFLNQDLDGSISAQNIMANQEAIMRAHQNAANQQAMAGGMAGHSTQKGLGSLTKNTQAMTPMQKSNQRIT